MREVNIKVAENGYYIRIGNKANFKTYVVTSREELLQLIEMKIPVVEGRLK